MDYEVNYATLAQAGQRATMIAAEARDIIVQRVDAGGVSGAVASRVDSMWTENAEEIGTALDFYSKALTSNAKNYQQVETAAAEAATGFFGGVS